MAIIIARITNNLNYSFTMPGPSFIGQQSSNLVIPANAVDLDLLTLTTDDGLWSIQPQLIFLQRAGQVTVTGTIDTASFDYDGVSTIHADNNPAVRGNIHLISGTNITLAQAGQDITINSSGGGGGGSPAAPDTSVQFNNGGSFGGSPAFLWLDGSQNLRLGDPTNVVSDTTIDMQGNGKDAVINMDHTTGNLALQAHDGSNIVLGSASVNVGGSGNILLRMDGSAHFGAGLGGFNIDTAGNLIAPTIRITTAPTNGFVLTSDASGNGTWQAGGGGSNPVVQKNVPTTNGQVFTISASGYYYFDGSVNNVFCIVQLPDATTFTPGLPIYVAATGNAQNQQVQFELFNNTQTIDGIPSGPSNIGNYSLDPTGSNSFGPTAYFISDGANWTIVANENFQSGTLVANTTWAINNLRVSAGINITAGSINLNNTGNITNLVDPSAPQDAATKNYVDTHSSGSPSSPSLSVQYNNAGTFGSTAEISVLSAQPGGKTMLVGVDPTTIVPGGITTWLDFIQNNLGQASSAIIATDLQIYSSARPNDLGSTGVAQLGLNYWSGGSALTAATLTVYSPADWSGVGITQLRSQADIFLCPASGQSPNQSSVLIGDSAGQRVGDQTAILDIQSTDQGFLPPRMTTAQRDIITVAANGITYVENFAPLTGATFTINGVVLTEGVEWTASTDNLTTATSLAAAITTATATTLCTAVAGFIAGFGSVTITANTPGPAGNSITTVSSDNVNLVPSGPTLAQGKLPAQALAIYNITTNQNEYYNGTVWVSSNATVTTAILTADTAVTPGAYFFSTGANDVTATLPLAASVPGQIMYFGHNPNDSSFNAFVAAQGSDTIIVETFSGTTMNMNAIGNQRFTLVSFGSSNTWVGF